MAQPFDDAIRDLAFTDGAVRPLPAPQAVPDADPPVATHAYYADGTWFPAAPVTLAGVYTQVMPLLRFVEAGED
jgi:hypothetical protein